MANESRTDTTDPVKAAYQPPAGAKRTASWTAGGVSIDYAASGEWIVLRKKEKPAAEIFCVSHVAEGEVDRPVTFVFNGGPGGASVFTHIGAVGPRRVAFPADGALPQMPPRLVANEESWLAFTDLVFVDPVGTGFSRAIEQDDDEKTKPEKDSDGKSAEYFGYKRDLESLCEFMGRWLSGHGRWGSPVFISGESYGGYRVARLMRMLQEKSGIGLSGAILISPALEFGALFPGDYDVLGWIDHVPTMAIAAVHHGRSRAFAADTPREQVLQGAEQFASDDYAAFLVHGASMPETERARILERLADLIGLPVGIVARAEGRITIDVFARELLRDTRKVIGRYDATITGSDPFPDREPYAGPDPTFTGVMPAYTMAINQYLRSEIGIETDREYVVLSDEAFESWRNDAPEHFFIPPVGGTDDFRYGMSLAPHMRVFIAHGLYDLVTPYYASDRLRNLMRLDPAAANRVTVRQFGGGHMFYAWEQSRRAFTDSVAAYVADAVATP